MTMKVRLKKKKDYIIGLGLAVDTNILKCKLCLKIMMVICIKQHQATSEAQFMKMLSKIEESRQAEIGKN